MGEIYHEGDPYSRQMVVDTALSKVSNNPLKNRIITGLIDDVIAPVEGANASQAYSAGDELILNNLLYKAKSAIAQDTPFDAGSSGNIELAGSIVDQLKSLFDGVGKLKRTRWLSNCNNIEFEADIIRYYSYNSDAQNAPPTPTVISGSLICIPINSYTIFQIAITDSYEYIYLREYRSAWSAWKQIYSTTIGSIYEYSIGSSSESFESGTDKTYTKSTSIPKGNYIVTFDIIVESATSAFMSELLITVNSTGKKR